MPQQVFGAPAVVIMLHRAFYDAPPPQEFFAHQVQAAGSAEQDYIRFANEFAAPFAHTPARALADQPHLAPDQVRSTLARRGVRVSVQTVYDVLNALAVLAPTDALTQLISVLSSIEDRAKLYYIREKIGKAAKIRTLIGKKDDSEA